MGLDIYICRAKRIDDNTFEQIPTKVKDESNKYVTRNFTCYGYFHKVYFLMPYFKQIGEDKVNNCEEFEITLDDIISLRDKCDKLIKKAKKPNPYSSNPFSSLADYEITNLFPTDWEWWSLPVDADFLFHLKCVKKVCGRIISYVKRHPLKENECLTFQTSW